MELVLLFTIAIVGIVAGILGALFGIGGGIIMIPVLTAVYGLDISEAAAVSLVGIVAVSIGGTVFYLEKKVTNVRMGLLLEIGTVIGSVIGAFAAMVMEEWIIMLIFAILMLVSSYKMLFGHTKEIENKEDGEFSYHDLKDDAMYRYDVDHKIGGSVLCILAGMISSMTGVGGGVLKVPVMNLYMGVPMKAATATSSYMIGITAFSGAMIYFLSDYLLLDVAGFVAVGTFIGAIIGSRISRRFDSSSLKKYFSIVTLAVAIVMFMQIGGVI